VKQFELEDLVFRRSARFTLEIDGFFIDGGERVAVVGPNGSGKTTLLRLLSFLERPDSWTRYLFRGQPYAPGKMDRRGLGFLRQQPLLFRGSVAENLAYPLKLRRLSSSSIRERVAGMLALMELDELAGEEAHRLSVGEQRRLALGRTLMADPETLLLDEPVAHLDARSRVVIGEVLAKAHQTILLTTHDVHFAHQVAGRVLSLRGGCLSEVLPVNVLRGRAEGGRLVTGQGMSVVLPETKVPTRKGLMIAIIDPRRLAISLEAELGTEEPPASGAQNRLRGRITAIRQEGEDVWLDIDCGQGLTAIVSRAAYEAEGLNLHREVVVSFGPDAVEII